MKVALLDAGPLVALFAPDDVGHRHYRQLLMQTQPGWQLTTTWPCVVEASHLLSVPARWRMLRWVAAGGAAVFPLDAACLDELLTLMRRYTQSRRVQMDFADASLVWLAAETGVTLIWTMDVRDFYRYRLPDGRGFEIL